MYQTQIIVSIKTHTISYSYFSKNGGQKKHPHFYGEIVEKSLLKKYQNNGQFKMANRFSCTTLKAECIFNLNQLLHQILQISHT